MKPRCRPGDMAIIRARVDTEHSGKVVLVVRASDWYADYWITRPRLQSIVTGQQIDWSDRALFPIRDPGEDATDEMVALLGKPASQPSKEHA